MNLKDERALYKGIDYTGTTVGGYEVIKKTGVKVFPSGNSHHTWQVRCLGCGIVKETQAQHVIRAKYGCSECKGSAMSGTNSCHWKGGRIVPGYFVAKVKSAAQRISRTLEYSLSFEYLDELWEAQGGLCAYTGWPLNFGKSKVNGTASLDRIDSSIGYVEGNVQFVHKDVNIMKWGLSDSRFREICTAIHERGKEN